MRVTPGEGEKRRGRTGRWVLLMGIAMPLALFALLAGYLLFGDIDPPEDGDLRVPPLELAPGENGFELVDFAEGEGCWDADELRMREATPDDEHWDDAMAERLVARYAEFSERLDDAFSRPEFVLTVLDWDHRDALFWGWQNAAYAIRLRALMRLHRGETSAAFEDALRIIRFARKIRGGRSSSFLYVVGTVIGLRGYETLGRVVSRTSDRAELRRIQEKLGGLEPQRAWLAASVKAEYALKIRSIDDDGPGAFVDSPSLLDRFLFRPNRAKARLAAQARANIEAIVRGDFRDIARIRPAVSWLDTTYAFRSSTTHGYRRIALEERAPHRVARILVALRLHYLAEGGLPETLEELVPRYLERVPASDWTAEPLLFSAEDRTIHSAGWNFEATETEVPADYVVHYDGHEFALRFEFRG